MSGPIYTPRGAAREYGELALNIYTGCPHRCYYCFAPNVLHKDREQFHSFVEPRKDIVDLTRKQLEKEHITGKTIHLCFTCDPYPTGYDSSTTREIIKLLKEYGNHVQILTKGDGSRDFDLLDENDWYGVTLTGAPYDYESTKNTDAAQSPALLLCDLITAHEKGVNTWVSFEPVLKADSVLRIIYNYYEFFDLVKIGKLNYHKSDIDWKAFGIHVEMLCNYLGIDYYIKDSLRKEMEA